VTYLAHIRQGILLHSNLAAMHTVIPVTATGPIVYVLL